MMVVARGVRMRTLMVVTISMLAIGCAHRQTRSVAERQAMTTPHGDFDKQMRRDDGPEHVPPVESPLVTPPIP